MKISPKHIAAWRRTPAYIVAALILVELVGCASAAHPTPAEGPIGSPASSQAPDPMPSSRFGERTLHQPPALTGSNETAAAQADMFLDWASRSTPQEQDDGRRVLAAASRNDDIARAFFQAAMAAEKSDHSRALMALSLLGEMRNRAVEPLLREFVRRPLPTHGTLVDGEIIEQTALATLQAKAIDGLAYLNTETANLEVLRAVARHPSRIVRAEAIDAYLWNQGGSEEARETLRRYVRKDEEVFLDRVRRERGESARSFNRKLKAYLAAHPEAVPPAPQRNSELPGQAQMPPPPQR